MIEKVRSFGGQVESVSSLGIEAVFGAERTEEPSRRAAHAALAIRRQLAVRRGPWNAEAPHLRMAIHTCQALVVNPGGGARVDDESKRQIALVIDALLAAAEPDSVVVSGTTARFLRRRFTLQPGARATPGLALQYLHGHEQFSVGGAGTTTVFTGRTPELGLLNTRLSSALTGHGQVVAVIGDPGVGKSRLLWEFTHAPRPQPVRVLETGSAYASITPYRSVIELLRRYFDLDVDADATRVREHIGAMAASRDQSLQPFLPALLALLDSPDRGWDALDPAERQYRIGQAVTRLLVAESRIQPVVTVVEDMHWIDTASHAVLDALIPMLPSVPIMLVVTARPECPPHWNHLSYYTPLHLRPLPPDSVRELSGHLLGTDSSLEPIKNRLTEWTEGNPFFLEESVQGLVETGALEGERGAYHAVRPLLSIDVPATVADVLAERIDRLAPDGKALIQTMAAIGPEVPLALLSAVLAVSEDALHTGLDQLQAAELVYEVGAAEEHAVAFKHALTREVAYRSLPPEAQRDLHRRIATAMEAIDLDRAWEHIDRLAHHALQGELWAKAVTYLRRAGDQALHSAATRQASDYFEQAVEALQRQVGTRDVLEEGIDLRFRLRDALWPQVRLPSILHHLREADVIAANLEDRRRQGWTACYLCQYYWAVGDLPQALEAGERALALARRLENLALQAEANVYRGVVQFALGAFRQSVAMLSEDLPILDDAIARAEAEFPSRRFVQSGPVILRAFLARALAELGEFPEALAHGNDATRRAGVSGSPFATAAASAGLGAVYVRKGEPAKAVQILAPAIEVCRTYKVRSWFATLGSLLGVAYVGLGRAADGVSLLRECVDYGDRVGLAASNALWLVYLGEAHLRAGQRPEALAAAERALTRCQERKERGHEAWAVRLLAELAATGEGAEVDAAEARYQQALAIGRECGMRPLVARCRLGLARLHALAGNRPQAAIHLRAATADFQALDMPWPGDDPDTP